MTAAAPLDTAFTKAVRDVRMEFLDHVEPHRSDLFGYCRSLTPDVWEAEDLVQETLLRAFAKLGEVHWPLENPRAYLFRTATNLWIDRTRRHAPASLPEEAEPEAALEVPSRGLEVREALSALVRRLPPQERAAVLLKDAFDFSLDETATLLGTTRGAVKAALNRGRTRLAASPGAEGVAVPGRARVTAAALDRFVEAFNARDLERLAGLLLEDASADVVGMVQEYGRAQIRDGSLHHTILVEAGAPRAEVRRYLGEPVVALFYTFPVDGRPVEALEDVLRLAPAGDDPASFRELRYYYFCPEVLAEVGRALGCPVRAHGHRYAPGVKP